MPAPPPAVWSWFVSHAREDVERGRALPSGLGDYLRSLHEETADNGRDDHPREIIDTGDSQVVAQVSQETGLSPRRLRHLCQTGQIHGWQSGPGCTWLIAPASVHDYLRRKTR